MTIEFKLPELGENIESGEVVNVLVVVGDKIMPEQTILELETDKATVEVPSSVSGVIKEVHVQSGQTIKVGQLVLTVEEATTEEARQPEPETASEPQQPEEPESKKEPPEAKLAQPAPADPPAKSVIEFNLPELGENIEAGDVIRVLVAVGDRVEANQPVLELETDKATIEVPVDLAGLVKEIRVSQGDRAAVGQVVLTLETVGAAPSRQPEPTPALEPAQKPRSTGATELPEAEEWPVGHAIPAELAPDPARSQVPAAPNLRRLAREIGVDIAEVAGTGPAGRITMDDVKREARQRLMGARPAAAAPEVAAEPLPDFARWGDIRREPMSNVRRKTAEHLSHAWAVIPHVTQFDQADIQELEQLRRRFAQKAEAAGGKLTITAILVKVAAAALKAFPKFNASIDLANQEIIYKNFYHIGIAVDTERGLLVPVIRDVDRKNILELAVELAEVSEKARNRKLSLEEMQGGCMSITNLGGIGGTNFTPIVNWPEAAILGVARSRIEPVYRNGQFEPRLMLPLALSYDHRLIDGADAARFLRWIVEALEDPLAMSLQAW